jgi:hypothetical protein
LSAVDWLSSREPHPPQALTDRLPDVGADGPLVDTLTEAGMWMLERAMTTTGKARDSAFLLLSADALLTYACEAAAEDGDPARALRSVLDRVGARS